MASPVFHGLAGAGLAYAWAGDAGLPLFASLEKVWKLLVVGVVLACLPDVDYVPGLMRGYLNTTHQQFTHGVAWVLLSSSGLWWVGKAFAPDRFGGRALVFLWVVVGSHLAIDLMTVDRLAPYGLSLWAPFSETVVRGPWAWLPAWDKTTLSDLGSIRNLRALGMELAFGTLFFAGCVAAKRGWTRRRGPL